MALGVAVAALAVVALLVRLVALGTNPGGLYPDEAAEGNSALLLTTQRGYHPIFFSDDGGREALYAYLVAAVFRIAGESVTSLRLTSVLLGVAMVPMVFLALRRLGDGAALAAAAWSGGTLWLFAISRDGMRNALVPVTAALAVWLLLRWADVPGHGRAFAAGAAVGAGLWTYQPLKLLPLLVIAWLWWLRRNDHPRFAAMWAHIRWLIAGYALPAIPMAVVAVTDPTAYFGRDLETSPLNPDNPVGGGAALHVAQVLGMFTVAGDPNPRHNAGGLAMLGWPLGLIAVAGAIRAWRLRATVPAASLVILGLVVMLIPPLVAVEGGTPHFLRSLGVAPFVAGLLGMGCTEVVSWAGLLRPGPATRVLAGGACAVILVATMAMGITTYFARPAAQWWYAYSADTVQMARAAHVGDTVISDGYSEISVQFIDHAHMPIVVPPSTRIHPRRRTNVYATRLSYLVSALGPALARTAHVAGRDPAGEPDVYVVAVS